MREVKVYKLIKDLPGAHKKGEIVTDNGTDVWVWKSTQMPVLGYDPSKEPMFFERTIDMKYHEGQKVMIEKTNQSFYVRNIKVAKVPKYDLSPSLHGTITKKNIPETQIFKYEEYWFINSSGKVCSHVLTPNHKDSYVYKFRVVCNNAHATDREANDVLNSINKLI